MASPCGDWLDINARIHSTCPAADIAVAISAFEGLCSSAGHALRESNYKIISRLTLADTLSIAASALNVLNANGAGPVATTTANGAAPAAATITSNAGQAVASVGVCTSQYGTKSCCY